MNINYDYPIVLGLAGGAATGKTVTADALAPQARFSNPVPGEIFWDHLFYALPLKRMASARQTIEGNKHYDRMCYEIHDTLIDIFGNSPLFGAPPYDDLVEMVYRIMETPCEREGKPRTFLQQVGTEICRGYDPNCWVKWMDRRIKEDYRHFLIQREGEQGEDDLPYMYGVVISDCRFENEARFVHEHPNGILLKLTATPEVIRARQLERDGHAMTEDQQNHRSERSIDLIPNEWFNEVIDTSYMTVREQVDHVRDIVTIITGVKSA